MILFRHAQIYDGTGQKPFLGDVLNCTNNYKSHKNSTAQRALRFSARCFYVLSEKKRVCTQRSRPVFLYEKVLKPAHLPVRAHRR